MTLHLAALSNSKIGLLAAPLSLAIFVSAHLLMSVPPHPCLNLLTLNSLSDLHVLAMSSLLIQGSHPGSPICPAICFWPSAPPFFLVIQNHPPMFTSALVTSESVALLCISFPGQKFLLPSPTFLCIAVPLIQHQLLCFCLNPGVFNLGSQSSSRSIHWKLVGNENSCVTPQTN